MFIFKDKIQVLKHDSFIKKETYFTNEESAYTIYC